MRFKFHWDVFIVAVIALAIVICFMVKKELRGQDTADSGFVYYFSEPYKQYEFRLDFSNKEMTWTLEDLLKFITWQDYLVGGHEISVPDTLTYILRDTTIIPPNLRKFLEKVE